MAVFLGARIHYFKYDYFSQSTRGEGEGEKKTSVAAETLFSDRTDLPFAEA